MTTTGQFRPSTHGLHFINFWPVGTPDYTVNVPIVGQVTIGDANNGLCGGMVLTVPIMTILGSTRNPWTAFLLMTTALVFLTGYTALSAIIKAEMFPTKVRALGVGLPHALVAATFGGTSETVALALKQAGIESTYFWYVTGCIFLTFIATIFVKESSKTSTLELLPQEEAEAVAETTALVAHGGTDTITRKTGSNLNL